MDSRADLGQAVLGIVPDHVTSKFKTIAIVIIEGVLVEMTSNGFMDFVAQFLKSYLETCQK
jgi:hypothetical protein